VAIIHESMAGTARAMAAFYQMMLGGGRLGAVRPSAGQERIGIAAPLAASLSEEELHR